MADNEQDPAGDTQQFRRFAQQQGGPEPDRPSRTALLIGVLAVGIIMIAAIVALLVS